MVEKARKYIPPTLGCLVSTCEVLGIHKRGIGVHNWGAMVLFKKNITSVDVDFLKTLNLMNYLNTFLQHFATALKMQYSEIYFPGVELGLCVL